MGSLLLRSPTLPTPCPRCGPPPLTARRHSPAPHSWPASGSACSSGVRQRSHTLRVAALEEAPAEASAAQEQPAEDASESLEGRFAEVSVGNVDSAIHVQHSQARRAPCTLVQPDKRRCRLPVQCAALWPAWPLWGARSFGMVLQAFVPASGLSLALRSAEASA